MATDDPTDPAFDVEGTGGSEAVLLPDLPEAIKLSVLEGLGYTLAVEDRVGELAQVFLVAEGWRSARNFSIVLRSFLKRPGPMTSGRGTIPQRGPPSTRGRNRRHRRSGSRR